MWVTCLLKGVITVMTRCVPGVVGLIHRMLKRGVTIVVKIRYGGGVAQMSGSEAGRTYARNKGGAYIRNRTTPLNPSTTYQQAVRQRLSNLSKYWSDTLTETQQNGWNTWAENNPVTDVFGESINLTGSQAFVKLNQRITNAGGSIIAAAPSDQTVTALTSATLTFDIGTGNVELAYAPSPVPANHVLVIRSTIGLSPGIRYVRNRLRTIDNVAAASTTPEDIETAWTARLGSLPAVGQRVSVYAHLLNLTNGAVSVALRTDDLVISSA